MPESLRAVPKALGLRTRLALTYVLLVALFALALGLVFRKAVDVLLLGAADQVLASDSATVKARLRFEKGRPIWLFDREIPDEAAVVQRLRGVFRLADSTGQILEASDEYKRLGGESAEDLRRTFALPMPHNETRTDAAGTPIRLRTDILRLDSGQPYLVTIGRSMQDVRTLTARFRRYYFGIVIGLLLLMGSLGWWAAGRALAPLNTVAHAAHNVTGENLSLRIAPRGAGDELDNLIGSFNAMVDRIEDSFNQVRRFSSDVSHEMRTPLTAIRGQLEVALMTAETTEQYREAILAAIDDVDQLAKVVRALLQLSQAESGQVAVARDPLDLAELAREVTEEYRIPGELQEIAVETHAEPRAMILGDRIQLERLISNLVSNAIKYSPPRGRVTVTVRRAANEVELCVQDTGRGIPPEHLPRIFDRFYRVPDGSKTVERGLGLGLSFVAWIARAHGAKIGVSSTPGVGTNFTVLFPSARGQHQETGLEATRIEA